MGNHSLLQGIFQTQGLNKGLLQWRQILYHPSHHKESESEICSVVSLSETPWKFYTVHGILQGRTLEWVAFPFSRRSSQPRDRTQISSIAGGFFTSWATSKAQEYWKPQKAKSCYKYFLVSARFLRRSYVNSLFLATIHRWTESECLLWAEQRCFRQGRQGPLWQAVMHTWSYRQHSFLQWGTCNRSSRKRKLKWRKRIQHGVRFALPYYSKSVRFLCQSHC